MTAIAPLVEGACDPDAVLGGRERQSFRVHYMSRAKPDSSPTRGPSSLLGRANGGFREVK
jgi:hypothetical protein